MAERELSELVAAFEDVIDGVREDLGQAAAERVETLRWRRGSGGPAVAAAPALFGQLVTGMAAGIPRTLATLAGDRETPSTWTADGVLT